MDYFKTCIFVIFSLITVTVHGYGPDSDERSIFLGIADMDVDGVADTLNYDRSNFILTIKLSSKDFEPFSVYYPGVYESGVDIQAVKGGFEVHAPHMRALNIHKYFYDERTKRFRLAGYWHEHVHSGWMNVNLIDENFSAAWHQNSQFAHTDSLIYYPAVNFRLHHDPIYLGDLEPDFMSMGYDILNEQEEIYTPPRTDTVRFIKIESMLVINNDCITDGDHLWMYYEDKNRKMNKILYTAAERPDCNDIIEITDGYLFYHDRYEDRYVVKRAVTDLRIVKPAGFYRYKQNKNMIP